MASFKRERKGKGEGEGEGREGERGREGKRDRDRESKLSPHLPGRPKPWKPAGWLPAGFSSSCWGAGLALSSAAVSPGISAVTWDTACMHILYRAPTNTLVRQTHWPLTVPCLELPFYSMYIVSKYTVSVASKILAFVSNME